MNAENSTQDPAAIERDIRRTQNDMSRTVDKLGDQLTPKSLFNALLDKAEENGIDANYLIDGARRNPIALGLIAAGAIWLVSDKDSKFPSLPHKRDDGGADELDLSGHDVHHRDYVAHMASLEMREGEDPASYQRRRDTHRATFMMCERKPDEDDHSFRQRLDDLTESFRQKRHAWMDSASEATSSTAHKAQQLASRASNRTKGMYETHPLIGGLLAAAVGAALGSSIPVSEPEQEALGDIGEKARDVASEQKESLTSKAMGKADQLVDQAEQKLEPQGQQGSGQSQQRQPARHDSGSSPSDGIHRSSEEGPFIISERSL